MQQPVNTGDGHAVVIGAGIGGLAVAMRLLAQGMRVTIFERHGHLGGKMRCVPSVAGPVDAGPTVMTMRAVFDELFEAAGTRLEDHVTLTRQNVIARHFWPDGAVLDLFDDPEKSAAAIAGMFGARDTAAFRRFSARAARLFTSFDTPVMRAPQPRLAPLVGQVMTDPGLIWALAPLQSLAGTLRRQFRDPRLRQLFGRYATYVGGHPDQSPALLSLIWHAEASGVWKVAGGMARLAEAMGGVIRRMGGDIRLNADVTAITVEGSCIRAVRTGSEVLPAELIVFNGDPRALTLGYLGEAAREAIAPEPQNRRALSAYVWSFAAQPRGVDLAHHNVFFPHPPAREFADIAEGRMPRDPALYVCAQDRGDGAKGAPGPERFEIIMNGAPVTGPTTPDKEFETCQMRTFATLAQRGLRFEPMPDQTALTTPQGFAALFPGSDGSLYGQSPHGMTAALRRPTARTALRGLYLAGGGAHPGAGIPMATLSALHAAEAIRQDRISTSTSRPMAMPGGMSTGSAMTAAARSRS